MNWLKRTQIDAHGASKDVLLSIGRVLPTQGATPGKLFSQGTSGARDARCCRDGNVVGVAHFTEVGRTEAEIHCVGTAVAAFELNVFRPVLWTTLER